MQIVCKWGEWQGSAILARSLYEMIAELDRITTAQSNTNSLNDDDIALMKQAAFVNHDA